MVDSRIVILTDTHFGARKGNQLFHEYFQKFYEEIFFPYLDSNGITTVVHCGDCFDNRKTIDYWSLNWAKEHFFGPLLQRGIDLHMIVGNHDIFYKQSTKINAPTLNLAEYENVAVYSRPQTATIAGVQVFMVPWICEDNAEEFTEALDQTSADICMGHLELAGFYANKDYQCQHGTDAKVFNKFNTVFSGHFHKKSTSGNITYLGNTYQMYWNDEGEDRGFHLFDLESRELEYIVNPNNMFHKIFYNEKDQKLINYNKYKDTYVKVIVDGKSTPVRLSRVVDSLFDAGVHDVKVIENLELDLEDDIQVEAEDTLTTLTKYVEGMEEDYNKQNIIDIFKSLYVEAQEV